MNNFHSGLSLVPVCTGLAERPVITLSEGQTIRCETEQKTKGMWMESSLRHKTQTTNLETQQPHLLFHMCVVLRVQVYTHPELLSQQAPFNIILLHYSKCRIQCFSTDNLFELTKDDYFWGGFIEKNGLDSNVKPESQFSLFEKS